MLGTLSSTPALERPDLLGAPVLEALRSWSGETPVEQIHVAEIDPEVADTAAFCERYAVRRDESANCVVLTARRGPASQLAACVVLATDRADVNGVLRRSLEARKASFAPTALAVEEAHMEYGGITPIGLPHAWPLFVDDHTTELELAVIGSGVRRSKLILPGIALTQVRGAVVGAFSVRT